jgi:hypothetical protein
MKMAAMKLGNTPRPAAWSPPLASFPPPVLILATSSSNSLPHLAAEVFWWMASVKWFVRCGGGRRKRQLIDEHLGQRGCRTEPGVDWAGRLRPVGPGPFRPGSAPVSSLVASCMIPYLCALACGPLTSFPSWLRLESLLCKLRYFRVESLKTCTLKLRSSNHLDSCSSRVLTLVGLHDLLPKCLVNLSRKSPL